MLTHQIRTLGQKYGLVDLSFEKMFRNKALGNVDETQFYGKINILSNEYDFIMQYKNEFANLFFEEDSYWLLWVCKCLYIGQNSILSILNEYIAKVCKITRGNLNTYKLNGWDVHILYVYQLVNYNFPKCIVPNAYSWNFEVNEIFCHFHNIYQSLSSDAQFILRLGSFLHDIGVTMGVKDHEIKGMPLTEQYYCEIGINKSLLNQNSVNLEEIEIIEAIRAMVGNHQIINQISAEASDKFIYEKMNIIKKNFSFSERLIFLYNKYFVGMMSVLAISDMMAVDDSLLSKEKFQELKEAYVFLDHIVKYGNYKRDSKIYGLKRLIALLKDDLKQNADNIILNMLYNMNDKGAEIIDFLYNVKFMSYAMAAIKPLENIEKSVRLIETCMEIYKLSSIPLKELVIKFDPDIDNKKLNATLEQSAKSIVLKKLIVYAINNEEKIIEIICK